MYKYIVFDFDGTLVNSKSVALAIINELAEKKNFRKVDKNNLDYLKKLSLGEKLKYLNIPLYKIPSWSKEFYGIYRESIKTLLLFDGMKDLLDNLNSKGYNIAIISSNAEQNIRELLNDNGIDYIKEIYCSNNILGKDKVIRKFLKNYKLQNTEIIYVGDEERDIIACKKNNVKIIWVDWGFDIVESIGENEPDFSVSTPGEILLIVQATEL